MLGRVSDFLLEPIPSLSWLGLCCWWWFFGRRVCITTHSEDNNSWQFMQAMKTGSLWNPVPAAWFQHWNRLPPLGFILCAFVLSQAPDRSECPLVLCWCHGKANLSPDNCSHSTSQGLKISWQYKRSLLQNTSLAQVPRNWFSRVPPRFQALSEVMPFYIAIVVHRPCSWVAERTAEASLPIDLYLPREVPVGNAFHFPCMLWALEVFLV